MRRLGVVTELASGPTEQFIKKLQSMNKEQLMNLVMQMYVTPDEKEAELLEGAEVSPVMESLAKQLGGSVSDLEVPVLCELNMRQIYALSGLLCGIGDETSPDYDPIKSFAYWFMTLSISHKRRSRIEILEALKSMGQQPQFFPEPPGRLERLRRWIKGE